MAAAASSLEKAFNKDLKTNACTSRKRGLFAVAASKSKSNESSKFIPDERLEWYCGNGSPLATVDEDICSQEESETQLGLPGVLDFPESVDMIDDR